MGERACKIHYYMYFNQLTNLIAMITVDVIAVTVSISYLIAKDTKAGISGYMEKSHGKYSPTREEKQYNCCLLYTSDAADE